MRRQALVACAILMGSCIAFVSCGGDNGSATDPNPPDPPDPPVGPNQLPTARFTSSTEDGVAPFTVTFDAATSSDPDGNLTSYAWVFGDGASGSGQQVDHTFTDVGLFKVVLTVRDDRGGEDAASDTVFVSSPMGSGSNTIEGSLWWDRDLNGAQDVGEPGLSRFVVFLDDDGDGAHDAGEALVFTDDDGAYAFTGLDGARTYSVTQALPFGWSNTTPGLGMEAAAAGEGPARIINGEETPIDVFPFQVALLQGSHQFCGGTLVNSQYVLTAAHCVDDASPPEVDVLIGTPDLEVGGERVHTTAIRTHPSFNNTLDYDVALLRLERPLLRPRVFLQTPDQPSLSTPGDTATVIGWGETENGTQPRRLRRVDVPIITNELCSEISGEIYGLIGIRTLCAGGRDLQIGPCYGDSGGPLLVPFLGTWAQIGIVSFTAARDRCGDVPAAFSRVSELLDYIVAVARVEPSGTHLVDWGPGTSIRADFGNYH